MTAQDDELLLHAYVDGELDAAGAIEMERRLAAEPGLAAQRDRLLAMRAAIRAHAPRETIPQALRARILAETVGESLQTPRSRSFARRYLPAASLAATIAVVAGLSGFFLAPRANEESERMNALLSAHMRSQISGRPVDIASADRHTVKPWLAAKLPVAAVVLDLAGEGFPLLGGRIDIVDGAAAPTLVYKRRDHLVSLTELPASTGSMQPLRETRQGYLTERWSDGEHLFVAISDLSAAELQAFAGVFREAAARDAAGRAPAPK